MYKEFARSLPKEEKLELISFAGSAAFAVKPLLLVDYAWHVESAAPQSGKAKFSGSMPELIS